MGMKHHISFRVRLAMKISLLVHCVTAEAA